MECTYSRITAEHLGSDASELDAYMFRLACRIASTQSPTASDREITDQMWGNGAWTGRALATIAVAYDSLDPERRAAFDAWRDQ